jgi:hypothetical protein
MYYVRPMMKAQFWSLTLSNANVLQFRTLNSLKSKQYILRHCCETIRCKCNSQRYFSSAIVRKLMSFSWIVHQQTQQTLISHHQEFLHARNEVFSEISNFHSISFSKDWNTEACRFCVDMTRCHATYGLLFCDASCRVSQGGNYLWQFHLTCFYELTE